MTARKVLVKDPTDLSLEITPEEAAHIFHYKITLDKDGKILREERFEEGDKLLDRAIYSYVHEGIKEITTKECFDKTGNYIGKVVSTSDPSLDEELVETYDADGNCERRLGGLFSTLEVPLEELKTNHNTSHIAVLGDLHGHYTLACTLLKRWEKETGKTLDAVLQVGDMGIFPFPHSILDEATKRFAEHDPDEISFKDFYEGKGDAALLFEGKTPLIPWNIFFVQGNHEDFDFLAQYAAKRGSFSSKPVDYFGHLQYLSNGSLMDLQVRKGEKIHIAGLGGTEQIGHRTEHGNFTNNESRKLFNLSSIDIDILLTHQPPIGYVGDGRGSEKILEFIKHLEPVCHFCGDAHVPGQKLDVPAKTHSYILNEVNFQGERQLKPRSMGILEWNNRTQNSFYFIEEPWLEDYTRSNYKEKLRELL